MLKHKQKKRSDPDQKVEVKNPRFRIRNKPFRYRPVKNKGKQTTVSGALSRRRRMIYRSS